MVDQKKLGAAVRYIRECTSFRPQVALILGSGLGDFADQLKISSSISTSDIPFYPRSTVQGHEGRLILGHIEMGKRKSPPLLVFKGRVHFYETGSLPPVLFPVYIASALGAKTLLVTNAAGGINRSFNAGDLMVINDILDLTFTNSNDNMNLPKTITSKYDWPESTQHRLFDVILHSVVRKTSEKLGLELREGTYCWLKGPTYETAAEIEMLRRAGADAVGMSTVPEILAAKSLNLKIVGISLISNLATGITGGKLSHSEVTETATRVKESFTKLMKHVLLEL